MKKIIPSIFLAVLASSTLLLAQSAKVTSDDSNSNLLQYSSISGYQPQLMMNPAIKDAEEVIERFTIGEAMPLRPPESTHLGVSPRREITTIASLPATTSVTASSNQYFQPGSAIISRYDEQIATEEQEKERGQENVVKFLFPLEEAKKALEELDNKILQVKNSAIAKVTHGPTKDKHQARLKTMETERNAAAKKVQTLEQLAQAGKDVAEIQEEKNRDQEMMKTSQNIEDPRIQREQAVIQVTSIFEKNEKVEAAATAALNQAENLEPETPEYEASWEEALRCANQVITEWEKTINLFRTNLAKTVDEGQKHYWEKELVWAKAQHILSLAHSIKIKAKKAANIADAAEQLASISTSIEMPSSWDKAIQKAHDAKTAWAQVEEEFQQKLNQDVQGPDPLNAEWITAQWTAEIEQAESEKTSWADKIIECETQKRTSTRNKTTTNVLSASAATHSTITPTEQRERNNISQAILKTVERKEADLMNSYQEADALWSKAQKAWESRRTAQQRNDSTMEAYQQARERLHQAREERASKDLEKTRLGRISDWLTNTTSLPVKVAGATIGALNNTIAEAPGLFAWLNKHVVALNVDEVHHKFQNAMTTAPEHEVIAQNAENQARETEKAATKALAEALKPPLAESNEALWKVWAERISKTTGLDSTWTNKIAQHGMKDPSWAWQTTATAWARKMSLSERKVQKLASKINLKEEEFSKAEEKVRAEKIAASKVMKQFEKATAVKITAEKALETANQELNSLGRQGQTEDIKRLIKNQKGAINVATERLETAKVHLKNAEDAKKIIEANTAALALAETEAMRIFERCMNTKELTLRHIERAQVCAAVDREIGKEFAAYTPETQKEKNSEKIDPPLISDQEAEEIGRAFLDNQAIDSIRVKKLSNKKIGSSKRGFNTDEVHKEGKFIPKITEPTLADKARWAARKKVYELDIKYKNIMDDWMKYQRKDSHFSMIRSSSNMSSQFGRPRSNSDESVVSTVSTSTTATVIQNANELKDSKLSLKEIGSAESALKVAKEEWNKLARLAEEDRIRRGGIPFDNAEFEEAWLQADKDDAAAWEGGQLAISMKESWNVDKSRWAAREKADQLAAIVVDREAKAKEAAASEGFDSEKAKEARVVWSTANDDFDKAEEVWSKLANQEENATTASSTYNEDENVLKLAKERLKEADQAVIKLLKTLDGCSDDLSREEEVGEYKLYMDTKPAKAAAGYFQEIDSLLTEAQNKYKSSKTSENRAEAKLLYDEIDELEKSALKKYEEDVTKDALKGARKQICVRISEVKDIWKDWFNKAQKKQKDGETQINNTKSFNDNKWADDSLRIAKRTVALAVADIKAFEVYETEVKRLSDIEAVWNEMINAEKEAFEVKLKSAVDKYAEGDFSGWIALTQDERDAYDNIIRSENANRECDIIQEIEIAKEKVKEAWKKANELKNPVSYVTTSSSTKEAANKTVEKSEVELARLEVKEQERQKVLRCGKLTPEERESGIILINSKNQAAKASMVLYAKANQAYMAGKTNERIDWNNASNAAKASEEVTIKAIEAQINGEAELAAKYSSAATLFTSAAALYEKAAQADSAEKANERICWNNAGDVTKASAEKKIKAIEAEAKGIHLFAEEEYNTVAAQFTNAATLYRKAVEADSAGKTNECICWTNAGDATKASAKTTIEALEAKENGKHPLEAYNVVAAQFTRAAVLYENAAHADSIGKINDCTCWTNAGNATKTSAETTINVLEAKAKWRVSLAAEFYKKAAQESAVLSITYNKVNKTLFQLYGEAAKLYEQLAKKLDKEGIKKDDTCEIEENLYELEKKIEFYLTPRGAQINELQKNLLLLEKRLEELNQEATALRQQNKESLALKKEALATSFSELITPSQKIIEELLKEDERSSERAANILAAIQSCKDKDQQLTRELQIEELEGNIPLLKKRLEELNQEATILRQQNKGALVFKKEALATNFHEFITSSQKVLEELLQEVLGSSEQAANILTVIQSCKDKDQQLTREIQIEELEGNIPLLKKRLEELNQEATILRQQNKDTLALKKDTLATNFHELIDPSQKLLEDLLQKVSGSNERLANILTAIRSGQKVSGSSERLANILTAIQSCKAEDQQLQQTIEQISQFETKILFLKGKAKKDTVENKKVVDNFYKDVASTATKAVEYMKKAIEAKIAGDIALSIKWEELARQSQVAMEYYEKAADTYIGRNSKEVADCLSNVGNSIKKAIEAEEQGNINLSEKWKEVTKQSQVVLSYREQAKEAYFHGNKQVGCYSSNAASSAEKVIKYMEKAIEAEVQGNINLSEKWKKVSKQSQVVLSYYEKAAEAYAQGNKEVGDLLGGYSSAASSATKVIEYMEKSIEAEIKENVGLSEKWEEVARQSQVVISCYEKAAEEYAKGNKKGGDCLGGYTSAASYAKQVIEYMEKAIAIEAEIKGDTVLSAKWEEIVKQNQVVIGYYEKAAEEYAKGNEKGGDCLGGYSSAASSAKQVLEYMEKGIEEEVKKNVGLSEKWGEVARQSQVVVSCYEKAAEEYAKGNKEAGDYLSTYDSVGFFEKTIKHMQEVIEAETKVTYRVVKYIEKENKAKTKEELTDLSEKLAEVTRQSQIAINYYSSAIKAYIKGSKKASVCLGGWCSAASFTGERFIKYMDKAIGANIKGDMVLSAKWEEVAKQSQVVANYFEKAAEAYDQGREQVGDCLNKPSSSAVCFAMRVISYMQKSIEAEAQGNMILSVKWKDAAQKNQIGAESYQNLADAYSKDNQEEIKRLKEAVDLARREAEAAEKEADLLVQKPLKESEPK